MAQQGTINVTTDNIFPIIKQFLYSDQEIFLRELISNAVDATQKRKMLAQLGEVGEITDTPQVEVMEITSGFLKANFVTNLYQKNPSVGSFSNPSSKYILLSQSTLETPKFFSLYGQEITGIESGISYGSSILGPKTFFQKQIDENHRILSILGW